MFRPVGRAVTPSHLRLCVAADDQQLGETWSDFVHVSHLETREIEPLKIPIAVQRQLDHADAQESTYAYIRTWHTDDTFVRRIGALAASSASSINQATLWPVSISAINSTVVHTAAHR